MFGISLICLGPLLARALVVQTRFADRGNTVNEELMHDLSHWEQGMHPETAASLRTVTRLYEAQVATHVSNSPWQHPLMANWTTSELVRDFAVADLEAEHDLDGRPKVGEPVPEPSVFVVVISRRDAADRRAMIRDMWQRITGTSGNITARFGICRKSDDEGNDDGMDAALEAEHNLHGDVIQLGCAEGYGQGHLTRKIYAAMQAYTKSYFRHDLFMKVDDDTFVRWGRFANFLVNHSHGWAYMGIPIGTAIPCRNKEYLWYEPYSTFPDAEFPMAMAGGPGYTLGKDLVLDIVNSGIGEANVLWNEDRAVGVWVHKLAQAGKRVEYIAVPGIDGWWAWDWEHPLKNWAKWGDYHNMVHHGLRAETIACLALADRDNDPMKDMDKCMQHEVGQTHEALRCYQLNEDAKPQADAKSEGTSNKTESASKSNEIDDLRKAVDESEAKSKEAGELSVDVDAASAAKRKHHYELIRDVDPKLEVNSTETNGLSKEVDSESEAKSNETDELSKDVDLESAAKRNETNELIRDAGAKLEVESTETNALSKGVVSESEAKSNETDDLSKDIDVESAAKRNETNELIRDAGAKLEVESTETNALSKGVVSESETKSNETDDLSKDIDVASAAKRNETNELIRDADTKLEVKSTETDELSKDVDALDTETGAESALTFNEWSKDADAEPEAKSTETNKLSKEADVEPEANRTETDELSKDADAESATNGNETDELKKEVDAESAAKRSETDKLEEDSHVAVPEERSDEPAGEEIDEASEGTDSESAEKRDKVAEEELDEASEGTDSESAQKSDEAAEEEIGEASEDTDSESAQKSDEAAEEELDEASEDTDSESAQKSDEAAEEEIDEASEDTDSESAQKSDEAVREVESDDANEETPDQSEEAASQPKKRHLRRARAARHAASEDERQEAIEDAGADEEEQEQETNTAAGSDDESDYTDESQDESVDDNEASEEQSEDAAAVPGKHRLRRRKAAAKAVDSASEETATPGDREPEPKKEFVYGDGEDETKMTIVEEALENAEAQLTADVQDELKDDWISWGLDTLTSKYAGFADDFKKKYWR